MLAEKRFQPDGLVHRRDERYRVLISATMRAGGRPIDVCIRDVSLRGICIVATTPPPRGTIVELTGPSAPIVGQVTWSADRRCGIAVGGRIDLPRLLAQRSNGPAPHELVPLPAYATAPAPPPKQCSAEDNRNTGKTMQLVFTVLLGTVMTAAIGQLVYETLALASNRVTAVLEAPN